jgi:hypothetical protein
VRRYLGVVVGTYVGFNKGVMGGRHNWFAVRRYPKSW